MSRSEHSHVSAPLDLPIRPRGRARMSRPIETILLASTACLLAAVAWPIASAGSFGERGSAAESASDSPARSPSETAPALAPAVEAPTIQLALLLDTSSSMDGLIDQARTQLWSVVNALDGATYHGGAPRLEIAIYEYGNDTLPGESGWIRQVQPFTSELDSVSEALFSLTTNGGTELASAAIGRSIDELEWRSGEGVREVLARIEAVLRRARAQPEQLVGPSSLRIPGGRVDLQRSELRFEDGGLTTLSEREAALLAYLAQHAARTVSRDEIIARVWHLDPARYQTRTIDMHVARLRDKLRDHKDAPQLIVTVRGKGYMLGPAAQAVTDPGDHEGA